MKEIWSWIQTAFTVLGGLLGWFLGGFDGFLYASSAAFLTISISLHHTLWEGILLQIAGSLPRPSQVFPCVSPNNNISSWAARALAI